MSFLTGSLVSRDVESRGAKRNKRSWFRHQTHMKYFRIDLMQAIKKSSDCERN